jgi:hypothetical protein
MPYPSVCPHDPIEQIADDVFMCRGSVKLNPILRITRNMAIVRHGGELTLINPLRMNDAELARLDALGEVKHLVRMGAFHGQDDPFYMDRYRPRFWSQAGGTTYSEPKIDEVIDDTTTLPFPDAKVRCFKETLQPESVILLTRGKGLLLTTDGLQHYGDYTNNNLPARILMPRIGFPQRMIVGPFWMKLMTPEGGSLKSEFDEILKLEFDALLSAHGTFLATGAHASVRRAVEEAYGRPRHEQQP